MHHHVVDATTTARGTLRGLGYVAEAVLAAERCRQTAEELGEPVPLAVADWARANVAGGTGSYRRGYTLATRAIDQLTRHVNTDSARAVLGMLHLYAAHARLREHPAEAFDHIDEAGKLAAITGELNQWWHYSGPTNVGIWAMGAYVDSGQPGLAIEVATTVRPGALPAASDRGATYWIELARAYADEGGLRDVEATRALLVAERATPQHTRSSTPARATAQFLLERAKRTSPLHGLGERMGLA